jgi:hypothetical protein
VAYWLNDVAQLLLAKAEGHDKSKLEPPEKEIFDIYTPKLKELKFGSKEYKAALVDMGEGLNHHYKVNKHHPEHYPSGIDGMTLYDIVEMFCDWCASAENKNNTIDIDCLAQRFNISDQLKEILINTMNDLDFWNMVGDVPVGHFTPVDKRKESVEL